MTDALVEAVGDGIEAAWNGSGSGGKPNRLPPIDLSQHERVHLATAALHAIEAAGYRVVPVEAMEGMVEAGIDAVAEYSARKLLYKEGYLAWSAMLSAAPRVGEE